MEDEDKKGSDGIVNDNPKTYSQEDYDKVKTAQENQSKALEVERGKRKADSEELEKFRNAENKKAEDSKKKNWKYLELIEEKDWLIKSLQEKSDSWDKYQTDTKERLFSEVSDLTSKLEPEVLEKNKFILEDLTLEKQAKFLKNLTDTNTKDFWKDPKKWGEKQKDWSKEELVIKDYEARQKLGEKQSPTQRADYLNALRKDLIKG